MKRYLIGSSLIIMTMWSLNAFAFKPIARQHLLLDHNWKFMQADVANAEQPDFNDTQWRNVNLPHDWSIEGEFKEDASTTGYGGYLPTGVGWYRKHLILPKIQKDQQLWVEFEGVYMNSDYRPDGRCEFRHRRSR